MSKYSRDRFPPTVPPPISPPVKTAMPARRVRPQVLRDYFALGPIPLSVAGAAGRAGPWCMSVLLAVRAWSDMTGGVPVGATWVAAALGANLRTVQRAISSLLDAGMVVRREDGVTMPSWSKLHRHVSGKP